MSMRNIEEHARIAAELVTALRELDDEDLTHDTVEGETDFMEAIDSALNALDDCAAIVEGCKAREKVLTDRRKRVQERSERIRSLVEKALATSGLRKVMRPTATVTLAKAAPQLIVTDEASVPESYWKYAAPTLDKAMLKAALTDGEDVPGVTLSNGGQNLMIRRS